MPKNKSEKHRGGRTHGRGKKAGRGKGMRGGRGFAGLHKNRYIWLVKNMPDHFGRHGFKRPQSVVSSNVVINVSVLREVLPKLLEEGAATKKGKTVSVNLTEMGIDKLLGAGKVDQVLEVTVSQASKSAIAKIEEAGGKVELE
jgi:large subunit ribosomal protein L15